MPPRSSRLVCSSLLVLLFASRVAGAEPTRPPSPGPSPSLLEQSTDRGGTGLLHLADPFAGELGTVRVSLLIDSFKGSAFLCNASAPCPDVARDSASHYGTSFAVSAVPLSFLEAYFNLRSYANANDQRSPSLLADVGDTTFGAKAFTREPSAGLLRFGGSAELTFLSSAGSVGIDGKGTSLKLAALGEADFRGRTGDGVPLRAHVNVGYSLDNSASVVEATELQRAAPITRIERFGLTINRVDQFQVGLGLDAPLGVARPFIEWSLGVPVNRQGYGCDPVRSFPGDHCLAKDSRLSAFPSKLSVGSRFFLFLPGLSATAAVDIGTSGTANFIEEMAPTLPWDLTLGVAYAFDIRPPAPPRVVEKLVEKSVPAPKPVELRLRGFVHPKDATTGIAKAIVSYQGRELTGMVTGADGHFISGNLEPGTYTLSVEAGGYQPAECSATVLKAQASDAGTPRYVDVDCELVAVPPVTTVTGHARDASGLGPIASVSAKLRDQLGRELELTTDASGSFRFEQVMPGAVTLEVKAEGYLLHRETVEAPAGAETRLEFGMHRRPKPARVTIAGKELRLAQPVRFEDGSGKLTSDSQVLLEEVADVLANAAQIKLLELQGYTDDTGNADRDQQLSEERARTVQDYLGAHGVEPARLTAKGYGATHPVSPNVTPAGRARNRRVRFVITEQAP